MWRLQRPLHACLVCVVCKYKTKKQKKKHKRETSFIGLKLTRKPTAVQRKRRWAGGNPKSTELEAVVRWQRSLGVQQ
jgi:hypothetical protein